jgi:hypothetical protein
VKPVSEPKLRLIPPAAHAGNSGYGTASTVHDYRREAREVMLAANTFEQGFQVAGGP